MGVDYSANYGLGFRIEEPFEFQVYCDLAGREILDMSDLTSFISETSDYWIIESGSYYDGDNMMYYIVLGCDVTPDLDLRAEQDKLVEYCKRMSINTIGEFGLQGGVLVF